VRGQPASEKSTSVFAFPSAQDLSHCFLQARYPATTEARGAPLNNDESMEQAKSTKASVHWPHAESFLQFRQPISHQPKRSLGLPPQIGSLAAAFHRTRRRTLCQFRALRRGTDSQCAVLTKIKLSCQLKIELLEVTPVVWRRLVVPGTIKLP
jgi:hypothetical protein